MTKVIQIKQITDTDQEFFDMADDNSNPCKSCGVCCSHFGVFFYQGELDTNGGTVPSELVSKVSPYLVAMKGTENGGRCTSLRGEIGKNISCDIYHNRSSSCRAFHVWDDQGVPNPKCQELRAKNGLKPLLHLDEISQAA